MKARALLKAEARKRLKGKWLDAAAFTLLWGAIVMALESFALPAYGYRIHSSNVFFMVVYLLVSGPLMAAQATYFLRLSRGKKVGLAVLREMFENFTAKLAVYVYYLLFLIISSFLVWMIIWLSGADEYACYLTMWGMFIALSMIIGLYFAQVWFVVADQPKIDPWVAIKRSAAMMYAHEGYFVLLLLSFAGWAILGLFTFGLGYLFLVPYVLTTLALFYQEVRPNVFTQLKTAQTAVKKKAKKIAKRS